MENTTFVSLDDDLICNHLHGERGVTQKIKKAMYDAAKEFVYIGFLLWEVKEYEYYYEGDYESVYEYAEAELGFKRSSTKNFIAIAETFGTTKKGYDTIHTMSLQKEYSDYNYSQLTEMLSMTQAQREKANPSMTVRDLRSLKQKDREEAIRNTPPPKSMLPQEKKPDVWPKQTEEWISINEGLPKEEERVLVCCETKAGKQNINLAYWDGAAWHGNGSMAGVTHWMMLPMLPRIKREQEPKIKVTVNNFKTELAPALVNKLLKTAEMKYDPKEPIKIKISYKTT